jgi:hypothetical protein
MGVKQTGKAYPKSDALLLMYGILVSGCELDRDYYFHATGISMRSFRRYISECQKWLQAVLPEEEIGIRQDQRRGRDLRAGGRGGGAPRQALQALRADVLGDEELGRLLRKQKSKSIIHKPQPRLFLFSARN